MRPCRICAKQFEPIRPLQSVCGFACAKRVAPKARKDDARRTRERLDELKPLSHWRRLAGNAFNEWIRLRDAALPCISCGATVAAQWDAGHYRTRGARPELAFVETNVHKQCSPCNSHLSGNLIRYRVGLIARVGLAEVERLEGPHEPLRFRAEDFKAIRSEYAARVRAAGKVETLEPHAGDLLRGRSNPSPALGSSFEASP